ncbi:MAG: c-di-GMP-binding flagellar brake protein YcgR [Planctomycetota bacterium]|jgi:c-di-GMP-binding flagellar brake protein YcgR
MQRRDHYRASRGRPDVLVAITWPNKQSESVILMNTSSGGLKFSLKERSLTALKVGQELPLSLKLNATTPAIKVGVVVRRVEGGKSEEAYACQFVDVGGLTAAKSEGLWKLFNRRGAFRVTAPIERKLARLVAMKTDGFSHNGILRNISTGGFSMEVPQDTEFEIGASAKCAFALKDSKNPLYVTAEIRHRTPVKGKVLLGFEFKPELKGALEDQVSDFVSMRQVLLINRS